MQVTFAASRTPNEYVPVRVNGLPIAAGGGSSWPLSEKLKAALGKSFARKTLRGAREQPVWLVEFNRWDSNSMSKYMTGEEMLEAFRNFTGSGMGIEEARLVGWCK